MCPAGSHSDELPTTLPDETSGRHDGSVGLEGTILARRYRIQSLLGAGGHAEVWDADDLLTRERVAVKVLRRASSLSAARARREITILRVLRVPGVVRLIDDGVDEGRAFLVMERVEGEPFPGRAGALPWSEVRGPALGLLETIGRIHAAGVVHRDLKPANVLVNRSGRPTVLDFGLSHVPENPTGALTQDREMLGTPLYLAPEQISGDPVTPRTDLYAVGVMLFQALTGRVPHEAPDLTRLMRARLMQRPKPVRELAPDVPQAVADVIARLLAVFSDERPRSAGEVIALLQGEHLAHDTSFPRLGGDRVVREFVEILSKGESVDVTGDRGTGRSRLLAEAEKQLVARGRRVVTLPGGQRAFASLSPLTKGVALDARASLAAVTEAMESRVREALREGVVVLVDDAERIDAESARVIERSRALGAVARVYTKGATGQSVHVGPLTESDLRSLFAGPDRVLHLREDGARALFARTDGNADRVVREIEAWVRAGLCRWDGDRLVISRDALDHLADGLRIGANLSAEAARSLPSESAELLAWVSLAWPASRAETIADAMGEPLWRVEADLQQLCALGAARALEDGRIEPRVHIAIDEHWPADRRQAAHRALVRVLPLGAQTRLSHLVACANPGANGAIEIAAEAVARGRILAMEGMLGKAVAALQIGLRALRDAELTDSHVESLMSLWVEIAIEEATPAALDRVLYEISRLAPVTLHMQLIEALVRAALSVNVWTPRAHHAVEALPPFSDPALERQRQSLRLAAARRASLEREEGLLKDLAHWAERDDMLTRATFAGWLGRLRYWQGRFEESATLHEQAAVPLQWMSARIAGILHAASANMEAFRLADAERIAREANGLARSCRHAYLEARSEWILRSVAYRRGDILRPDHELVGAVSHLSSTHLESTVALCEAAIALRAGDHGTARSFASHAHRLWTESGYAPGLLLAAGLLSVVDRSADSSEVESLATDATNCPAPGIGIQVLGLLARSGAIVRVDEEVITRLAATVPREHWSHRMDVLSVEESLTAIYSGRVAATSGDSSEEF